MQFPQHLHRWEWGKLTRPSEQVLAMCSGGLGSFSGTTPRYGSATRPIMQAKVINPLAGIHTPARESSLRSRVQEDHVVFKNLLDQILSGRTLASGPPPERC